ncbi:MAG: glyoxalase/bleomycin resistance protein/dioxygenase superfamily protein [Devosia sp.]|uniref:VOC family protein n=1 Tax=Devosia sp. TaxID=1871048 RepID=UPI002619D90F|nr:VOC family protein [Devosia sp.]MDB5531085.1 glyoxalase/bleomycin resistance protein/dioxygenase superfamily protein [Devosia sp.]
MTSTRPPYSIVGIDHVVFLVGNMEQALKFYVDGLGCVSGYSYPDLGMEQVWCGSALIVLWDISHPGAHDAVPPISGGRNVDHVCIAVNPFDPEAVKAHLQSCGIEIDREAMHGGARGVGQSFYFLDPFGNKIELKGPAIYPDGRG